MPTSFSRCWQVLETSLPRPARARRIIRRDWGGFRERIERGDEWFAKAICASLYAGDCYILAGAFPPDFMASLQNKARTFFASEPSSFHKMVESPLPPDFHRVIDAEEGRKYSFPLVKHSAYYFPWNRDPVWEPVWERWRVIKTLMGLEADEYEKNTPKDGVVDRLQIVQYPSGSGYLPPHSDPYLYQRLFISSYMSKRGVDFDGGGFYLVGADNVIQEAEDEIEIGDIGIGYATVTHGVAPTLSGERWFLGLYSNASDEVADRHTGHEVTL